METPGPLTWLKVAAGIVAGIVAATTATVFGLIYVGRFVADASRSKVAVLVVFAYVATFGLSLAIWSTRRLLARPSFPEALRSGAGWGIGLGGAFLFASLLLVV